MCLIIEGVLSVSGGIWIDLSKGDTNMSLLHLLRYTSQHYCRFLYVDGQTSYAQYEKYTRRNARPGNLHIFNYNMRKY